MMLLDQDSRAVWAIAGGTGKSRVILLAAIAIIDKLCEDGE
jgi:type I site-specific restriction endonuclease